MAHHSTIRFLLDGQVREVAEAEPTRTVLQYLREDLRRTGTKEGCAEGDCGACTVAIAEPDAQGSLQVRAVNSCIQFLATLDGKELFTAESLAAGGDRLHPVQQAMVDCHASQCGFCTPGFVMSLFALFKTNPSPSRRDIDDALAGNLCRCTGYRPIIAAAERMYTAAREGGSSSWLCQAAQPEGEIGADERERAKRITGLGGKGTLYVRHEGTFFAPRTLNQCTRLLERHPEAILLAGGTDVGLWVTKDLREFETVIYVGRIPELQTVDVVGNVLEIGAAVTLTDAMPAICAHYPQLEELFLRFASPPIRNVATLGGNIANGSPIGDSMPALITLGTTLILRMSGGVRELPLEDFYLDYRKTALHRGEVLERIRIPLLADGARVASYKVSKRFDQDISAVCAAFRLELDADKVREVCIVYGGMAAVPKRTPACEAALAGGKWNDKRVRAAMKALAQDFQPISDMRSSARYRMQVARNLLYRFFLETTGAAAVATPRVYGYGRQNA